MPELELLGAPRPPPNANQIQRNIMEEHVELWWFQEPRKSSICYGVAVVLILACGVGGIALLYSTSSRSGEWRLAVGTTLCLLALLVLLKQLLSSAIQDMNCIRSREQVELLKSGGASDCAVLLLTALVLLVCGTVLTVLSTTSMGTNTTPRPLASMFVSGIVLTASGAILLLSVLLYFMWTSCCSVGPRTRDAGNNHAVFMISGRISADQRLPPTSSMANLI
ncbi:transmembrane protein 125 [Anolis carolinensis]|uniref:transmembrane protein 125 n=1 Tax=Anolis carolinensis TaxID=28377 RepID=UPI0001F9DC88|nr:PREDICTED: transmembrane protein 125 [Anolis carolinensis]XP_008107666.1 PREDICTED: transmembrane protein 125 [Anolis carolinensis]XP_008107668.1 PREDICTED: transmembrane protein 125 [Anolis carolinensis]|eukprot:XP_008107664.1 PREDICTED: transmembrane protein 125 [Anolis carolinensis]